MVYLMKEDKELFYCEAANLKQAKAEAATWNAKVLSGPFPESQLKVNPYTIKAYSLIEEWGKKNC